MSTSIADIARHGHFLPLGLTHKIIEAHFVHHRMIQAQLAVLAHIRRSLARLQQDGQKSFVHSLRSREFLRGFRATGGSVRTSQPNRANLQNAIPLRRILTPGNDPVGPGRSQ